MITTKEEIISIIEKYYQVQLKPVKGKQIMFQGVLSNKAEIILCTPQSKLYPAGYGWIDITKQQVAEFENAKYNILALRVEGNKVYYMHFSSLKKYLTAAAMVYNDREGDHWKLRLWPTYIEVLGNKSYFNIQPNNFNDL